MTDYHQRDYYKIFWVSKVLVPSSRPSDQPLTQKLDISLCCILLFPIHFYGPCSVLLDITLWNTSQVLPYLRETSPLDTVLFTHDFDDFYVLWSDNHGVIAAFTMTFHSGSSFGWSSYLLNDDSFLLPPGRFLPSEKNCNDLHEINFKWMWSERPKSSELNLILVNKGDKLNLQILNNLHEIKSN